MKILILQFKRIGDLILTTPAIRCLREAFPGAEITAVIDSSCAGISDAIDVDTIWVSDKTKTAHFPRLRADWCLDFSGTDRSALFTFLSFSRRRVTFGRFRNKFARRFLYSDFVDSSVRDRHTADHYTDLLQPLGVMREDVPIDLRLPESPAILDSLPRPYAVIHAGTARAEKYWLPDRWVQVMQALSAEFVLTPVLTGSNDPAEQEHLAAIKAAFSGRCIDLSGKTSLIELAAVIRGARLFCGVDTAAMHLADAVNTPTVALFGPTNPFHWMPRRTRAVVLRADTEQPFSPKQKGGPMDCIPTEAVLAGMRELLA